MAHKKSKKVWLTVIVLILAAGGAAYYVFANRPVIDRKIVDSAGFSVYAPKRHHEGYTVKPETINLSHNTLSYVMAGNDPEEQITVTIQPRPARFSMDQMIDRGSIKSSTVTNGTLYDLSANGSGQYLLDKGDALIFMTSPDNINTATINSLVNSFTKLK